MKHIFTLAAIALSMNFLFAGDDQPDAVKNVRFGLKFTPSINWYKPEGKIISANGSAVKLGGGLIVEFRLAKVASVQTGIQLDMGGGKIKYSNGGINTANANNVSYYYLESEDRIAKYNEAPNGNDTLNNPSFTHYQLNERQYNITYITIPLTLKLKTKEIGIMTYYGQIGVNSSFLYKAKANDDLVVLSKPRNGANESKSASIVTKDVSIINEALNFGLGAEMNLSGSTSLTFGLNYMLGFTNVVKSNSDYLLKRSNGANFPTTPTDYSQDPMPQTLKSNSVVLTIGVLF